MPFIRLSKKKDVLDECIIIPRETVNPRETEGYSYELVCPSVCLSVFKVCPNDISETSCRIDLIFHTRINHNLKVCLVVVLFDSAKKCQNDRTLKHLLHLFVCTILSRLYLRDHWPD